MSFETNTTPTTGNDTLVGTTGNDTIDALAGNDSVNGLEGNDSLIGNVGDDTLRGGTGDDTLSAGDGNDSLFGDSGLDRLFGGSGADTLFGDDGADRLFGDDGNDSLDGGALNDTLTGGAGDDTLNGGTGNDSIDMSVATAGVTVDLVAGTATGALGNDVLIEIDGVFGSSFGDRMTGNTAVVVFQGAGGDDTLTGGTGNDTLWGGTENDSLNGGDGADQLGGEAGDDTIVGGGGNDLLFSSEGADRLTGGAGADRFEFSTSAGNDTITDFNPAEGDTFFWWSGAPTGGQTGLDLDGDGQADDARLIHPNGTVTLLNFTPTLILGGATADSISGLPWNDVMNGQGGNDVLQGLGGDDSLVGDVGDDTLAGGAGGDTLFGGDGGDFLTEGSNTIRFGVPRDVDGVGDSMNAGAGNDLITASALDTVDGGTGDDLLKVSATPSTAAGWYELSNAAGTAAALGVTATNIERWAFDLGDNNDTAMGSAGDDAVAGFSGADSLDGKAGNDALIGGLGVDTVRGGDGDDYIGGGDGFVAFFATTIVDPVLGTVVGRFNTTVGASGDNTPDLLDGGDGDDRIAADHLDTVDGGTGKDNLELDLRGRVGGATFDLSSGAISAALATALGMSVTNVEAVGNLLLGDAADSVGLVDPSALFGPGFINTVLAGGGNDTITGAAGRDSMFGGAGDDVLIGGGGNDVLTGDAGNDRLTGGVGADTFEMRTIFGNIGNDTVTDFSMADDGLNFTGSTVTLLGLFDGDGDGAVDDMRIGLASGSFTATAILLNAGFTQLGTTSAETLNGTAGTDVILGNNGADRLNGANGDDALFGGQGNDTLDGGLGADLLNGGDGTADVVTYQAATGQLVLLLDQGVGGSAETGVDTYQGVERWLLGAGSDIVTGAAAAESVDGGAGDDWMNLGDGNDTLNGGAGGSDILVAGAGNDVMFGAEGDQFYGGDGVDTVNMSGMSVGVAISTGGGWTAVGAGPGATYGLINAVEVVLTGAGDDSVYGFTGLSTVFLGAGNDFVADYSDANNDAFFGEAGNDALYGLGGADLLDGGAGNDFIIGGNGDDTIVGGDGYDWIQGGAGADVFRYTAVSHSRTSSGIDAISDFARGTDMIDLSGIDANTALAGDQAFTIGALQAGQAGRLQIILDPAGTPAWAILQGDVDGDGVADFDLVVFGPVAGLSGGDFVL
jgi:Ca2+-binding RTX toxin-like protein